MAFLLQKKRLTHKLHLDILMQKDVFSRLAVHILPNNNQLTSIINFKFEEIVEEEFIAGTLINSGSDTYSVFGRSMSRSEVEAIIIDNVHRQYKNKED